MEEETKQFIYWTIFPIVGLALFVGLMSFMVWSFAQQNKKDAEKSLQNYQDCKQRTEDIEWCFNQFRPYLDK